MPSAPTSKPRPESAALLYGWDMFVSFALGPPPRGSRSYASDLARRLRERGFTVFFSEEEASPGAALDDALRRALHRARCLVIVANRDMLVDPRWVRTEVEEFRRRHPGRPVIPISIDGALQDTAVGEAVESWLGFRGRIWIDETAQAFHEGVASAAVVDSARRRASVSYRAGVRWRRTVAAAFAVLGALDDRGVLVRVAAVPATSGRPVPGCSPPRVSWCAPEIRHSRCCSRPRAGARWRRRPRAVRWRQRSQRIRS